LLVFIKLLGALFPTVKRPGREADHSPQSIAEVNDFSAFKGHLNPYIFENIYPYSQQEQEQQQQQQQQQDDDDENDTEKFVQLHAAFLPFIGIMLHS